MKIKTSELQGAALDWAVSQALGVDWSQNGELNPVNVFLGQRIHGGASYSSKWEQGGPIIEREKICTAPDGDGSEWRGISFDGKTDGYGPTPLIAAMRCYVASKMGDEVDVPKELL